MSATDHLGNDATDLTQDCEGISVVDSLSSYYAHVRDGGFPRTRSLNINLEVNLGIGPMTHPDYEFNDGLLIEVTFMQPDKYLPDDATVGDNAARWEHLLGDAFAELHDALQPAVSGELSPFRLVSLGTDVFGGKAAQVCAVVAFAEYPAPSPTSVP